jgi:hypothetical protein
VRVSSVDANADQVASLLLPSVRVFVSSYMGVPAARRHILIACGLRQAGYKHSWVLCQSLGAEVFGALQVIASCCRSVVAFGAIDEINGWVIFPEGRLPNI